MWLSITETRSYMDWFFVAKSQIMRLINTGIWRHLNWLALVAGELATGTVFKTPTNMYIFHVISSMTYDVIKKRIGNFLSGWTLNESQKTFFGYSFFKGCVPTVSSPLFSWAPPYPSTTVEQILWGDQNN